MRSRHNKMEEEERDAERESILEETGEKECEEESEEEESENGSTNGIKSSLIQNPTPSSKHTWCGLATIILFIALIIMLCDIYSTQWLIYFNEWVDEVWMTPL